jgi:hypothetical protein
MMRSMSHIEENFEAFRTLLPQLPKEVNGKFALMRDQKIVDFFDSAGDAKRAGKLAYTEGNFSIQQVIRTPIDLGFYSYALAGR